MPNEGKPAPRIALRAPTRSLRVRRHPSLRRELPPEMERRSAGYGTDRPGREIEYYDYEKARIVTVTSSQSPIVAQPWKSRSSIKSLWSIGLWK